MKAGPNGAQGKGLLGLLWSDSTTNIFEELLEDLTGAVLKNVRSHPRHVGRVRKASPSELQSLQVVMPNSDWCLVVITCICAAALTVYEMLVCCGRKVNHCCSAICRDRRNFCQRFSSICGGLIWSPQTNGCSSSSCLLRMACCAQLTLTTATIRYLPPNSLASFGSIKPSHCRNEV